MSKLFFLSVLLLVGTFNLYAQSSCSCSVGNGGCEASQSCPEGYIAVCVCSASGCSSSCQGKGGDNVPEGRSANNRLQNLDAEQLSEYLTTSYGKKIVFEPLSKNFRFSHKLVSGNNNHWENFDYLNKNGKLLINGNSLEFWKGIGDTLSSGGEFSFCTSGASARMILNEISFLTGKKFSITSPEKNTVNGVIKGNSLAEILDKLRVMTEATIVEEK